MDFVIQSITKFSFGFFLAQFVQKLQRGPKISKLVTWPRPCPLWGVFVVRTQEGSVLYVCTRLEIWPRPRPFRGRFMVLTQEGYVLYVYTKFEADSSILSKVIKGVPKFRNWVTWPRPRPLMGRFIFLTQESSVSISVPNLKWIAQFVQKLLRGYGVNKTTYLEIRSRHPGHAHLGSFYDPYAGRVRPLCLYQMSSR